ARLDEARQDLAPVERLPPVVLLDDAQRALLDALVGRVAPPARHALPAAADREPVAARPRVDHAVVVHLAERALQGRSLRARERGGSCVRRRADAATDRGRPTARVAARRWGTYPREPTNAA